MWVSSAPITSPQHRSEVTAASRGVRIHFKAPWRSGAAHADMSPDKFIARLCALVPPPGFHMTRYFGVFANRHHLRAPIIPPSVVPAPEQQLPLGLAFALGGATLGAGPERGESAAAVHGEILRGMGRSWTACYERGAGLYVRLGRD